LKWGEIRNAKIILSGKLGSDKCIRRPRHRWEDNIKTNLKEVG
jgi:hypothetical protein